MSNEKFHNKYRIPSARAIWHDYGGGAYFVTVCTRNRKHYFGEICDGKMDLLPTGQCLHENLQNITAHYPYTEIPLFVVMPNHWHAIIFIDGEKTPYQRRYTDATGRDGARPVSEMNATGTDGARPVSTCGVSYGYVMRCPYGLGRIFLFRMVSPPSERLSRFVGRAGEALQSGSICYLNLPFFYFFVYLPS